MKVEIGDLVFCHTIGNKLGWRLNQVGIVVAGSKKDTRFRAYLSMGVYDEFTVTDIEKGNVELISKASGEPVKLSKAIETIPNWSKILENATITTEQDQVERAFEQR